MATAKKREDPRRSSELPYGAEARNPAAKEAKKELAKPRGRGRPPKERAVMSPTDVAKRIQVTQLINVLHKVAIDGMPITTERLKAIEILLKKAIPDLKAIDLTADMKGQLEIITNVVRNLD